MGYPEPEAPDGADNDDLWDEPTQAYTGARLANVVRNVQSQELADSGLRLTGSPPAPSPPRDPQHEPAHQEGRGADVTEQQPERSATATKDLGDPVAALKTSQAVLTDAISRAVEDLPGQLRNTASEATVDLEGHAAAESELPLPLNPRWPWIPHWQWMQDHRILLPLVGFFALTTIILGIVTVSLAMGSNSSEQSAVTDATKAQLAQPATRKQPERAKTEARAPSTSKVKVVNATDTEPGTADNEDSSKDETDSSAEAEEDTDAEDEAQEGTATVPQPARPRTTWRTRRRKEPRAKHYVPNDI